MTEPMKGRTAPETLDALMRQCFAIQLNPEQLAELYAEVDAYMVKQRPYEDMYSATVAVLIKTTEVDLSNEEELEILLRAAFEERDYVTLNEGPGSYQAGEG